MTQHFARPTASPLIAPDVCSLILLAPSRKDLTSVKRRVRSNVRRNFLRIASAANVAAVPPFVYSHCEHPGKHAFASHFAKLPHREFATGAQSIPWQYGPLRDAVSEHDRSVLVLAGFWFERQVVATALHALADSYDVYFVLDASPAKMRAAAVPSNQPITCNMPAS